MESKCNMDWVNWCSFCGSFNQTVKWEKSLEFRKVFDQFLSVCKFFFNIE